MSKKCLAKPLPDRRGRPDRVAYSDPRVWFAELDRLKTEPFMKGGRKQPTTPRRVDW